MSDKVKESLVAFGFIVAVLALIALLLKPTSKFERSAANAAILERCRAMGGNPVLEYSYAQRDFYLAQCVLPARGAH